MKPGSLVAAIILVVTVVVTLFAFSGSIANHTTISDAIKRPAETLQVPGKIVQESVHYQKGALRFDVLEVTRDAQKGEHLTGNRMTIVYAQPKPENFDTATSVEAIGEYRDGVFHASNLLVKCPSKYNDKKA